MNDIIITLEQDGVILYPSDTVWSLGGAMSSETAYYAINRIKGRDRTSPLILLVDGVEMLQQYVHIHPRIETLHTHHTRPLTVIYDQPKGLPTYVLDHNGAVAIRIARDPFVATIIDLLGEPITHSSANITGGEDPEVFDDVEPGLLDGVDYVCLHRREEDDFLLPSVVVAHDRDGDLIFLRT